ncbi:PTS sugar transporter subunit IIA [Dellaglioa sp. L3N]
MTVESLFNHNWVALNVKADSENELFDIIGKKANELFLAYPGYCVGLQERESSYPTGLDIDGFNIALPHVDTKYIKQPFVFLVTTLKPLMVRAMVTEEFMLTNTFFFLGIKDGHEQVGLLSGILNALQEKSVIKAYQDAVELQDPEELVNIMQHALQK